MGAPDRTEQGRRFHALHRGERILALPNAWDAGSAILMEEAGFPALASTSSGVAFANGFRDGERMGRTHMLECVARIVAAVGVPVSADLESGYGPRPEDVAETIRAAIAVGVVGVNLEDSPPSGGAALLEAAHAVERIRAAREAADAAGVPFVINARTDPFLRQPQADAEANFAEAVRRAALYRAAGADCIFVPGRLDAATIGRLVQAIDAPLNVLGAFSGGAGPTLGELQALGVRRVSIGGSLQLATMGLVRRAMEELRDQGTFGYVQGALTNAEVNALMERRQPKV